MDLEAFIQGEMRKGFSAMNWVLGIGTRIREGNSRVSLMLFA